MALRDARSLPLSSSLSPLQQSHESSQTNTKLTPRQQPPAKPSGADPTGNSPHHLADSTVPGSAALTQRAPAPEGGLLRPSLAAARGGGGGAAGGAGGAGGGGSSCGSLQPLRSASPPGRSPRRWVPRCSPRGLVQREQMLPGC